MGAGLAQIGIIMVLTVVGLPLFFFALMAALDRFERSLSAQPRTITPTPDAAAAPEAASGAPVAEPAAREGVVVPMPIAAALSGPSSVKTGATKPATAV